MLTTSALQGAYGTYQPTDKKLGVSDGSTNPAAIITPGQAPPSGGCSQQCPPFSTLNTGSCQCVPCPVSTCPFGQTLDPLTCACRCPATTACAYPQVFDDILCTCRCSNIVLCKGQATFNLDTCKCECPLVQTGCGQNQVLDAIGCMCQTPPTSPQTPAPINPPAFVSQCQFTVCRAGQRFNPTTCACECSPSAASSCNSLQRLDPNTCQCVCVRVMAIVVAQAQVSAPSFPVQQQSILQPAVISSSSGGAGTRGPGGAGTRGPGGPKGTKGPGRKGRRNLDSLLRVARGPRTKPKTKPKVAAKPSVSISNQFVQSPQVVQSQVQYAQSQSIQVLPFCPAGQIADVSCNCR